MMDLTNIVNSMVNTANTSNELADGDYVDEDGLICCGKCNTRKQKRLELLGREITVMIPCKCREEELDRQEAEEKESYRQADVSRMKQAGFQDVTMVNYTFENDDGTNPWLSNIAKNYVENFEKMRKDNKGLLFFGGVGVGKTYASACIANALIEKGYPCLVTNFQRLINTIEGMRGQKQDYLDSLSEYVLLVIDDLASERNTEYMQEFVYQIIDSRYRSGLPIIVTTNLTSQELKNPSDMSKQRIYSRLFQMCIPVDVKGKDRRKTALINDYSEYAKLLGLEEKQ